MAFGVCVRGAIPFSLKEEGKIQGGDRSRHEAGGEFFLLLSRFSLHSRGESGWRLRQRGCHLCGAV